MKGWLLAVAALVSLTAIATPTHAATIPSGDFSIEVSPSPISLTVRPGTATTTELRVRNAGLKPEKLKIEARDFEVKKDTGEIVLGGSTPLDLAQWVQFAEPTFTVQPGKWYTQKITITLPDSAGFSYPFAVAISRVDQSAANPDGTRLLKGSVAVFALVNVDKPGATRTIDIESITTSQPIYEYLPAKITVRLKNNGNSIVQPYGNIYLQRGSNATKALGVLSLNDARSYILPGSSKDMTAKWDDGWPVRKQNGDKTIVDWNDESTSHFRIGKYTAKVVAVYNDGTRDVPVSGEVTFWVIPWKLLLGALLIIILVGLGIWSIFKQISQKIKHLRANHKA